eukprot:evm.model.scf_1677.1 EVM.evm.TU.scf_1677.1   scf_1677:12032-17602(-)
MVSPAVLVALLVACLADFPAGFAAANQAAGNLARLRDSSRPALGGDALRRAQQESNTGDVAVANFVGRFAALGWGVRGDGAAVTDLQQAGVVSVVENEECESERLWGRSISNKVLCAFGFKGDEICEDNTPDSPTDDDTISMASAQPPAPSNDPFLSPQVAPSTPQGKESPKKKSQRKLDQ